MTWEKQENTQWPTPLRERKGGMGKIVCEYVQETEATRGEEVAYARVLARTAHMEDQSDDRRSRRFPMLAAALAMTCVFVAAAVILRHRVVVVSKPTVTAASQSGGSNFAPASQSSIAGASLPAAKPSTTPPIATPKVAAAMMASIRLLEVPTSLPAGRVDINGQATAVLSADAVASARTQTGSTEIVLGKGNIELRVLPRAPGHSFSVRAGLYQFTVVGTVFAISQTRSRLELVVSEGTVAVSRGTRRLATVVAGGKWAVEVNPVGPSEGGQPGVRAQESMPAARMDPLPVATPVAAPTPAVSPLAASVSPERTTTLIPPPAALPPAPVTGEAPVPVADPPPAARPNRNCGELAVGKHTREALLCYQEQASQRGLAGETAQYELARLWRDSLGEPERALAAFKDQRSRFPKGALRTEADLSIIEILPRLGRHTEAMAETEQFLADHPQAERRGEIRLLRGNIFREVKRDLDRAEREYARGAESGGRVGDDCRFLRAVCLEALGRVGEARKAYEVYLLGSKAAHVEEVKKRLERLRP